MWFINRYSEIKVRKDTYSERTYEERVPRTGVIIRDAVIFFAALIFLLVCWPLYQVPTGHRGVITVGGKISGIEGEGFGLKWPWETLYIFNVRSETAEVKGAEGGTIDQQPVNTSIVVRYSIMPDKVAEVFEQYSKDGNLDSYINTAVLDTFKAVTAKYTAPELMSKRAQVANDVSTLLKAKVMMYGARIINIDITNFAFSAEYMKAINAKTTEEQQKLAEANKTERVRAQEQQKVVIAEAAAKATQAAADGEAYAILKLATAQAESLRIQNAALAQNKDVLELRKIEVSKIRAEKWNGVEVPNQYYGSAAIPLKQF